MHDARQMRCCDPAQVAGSTIRSGHGGAKCLRYSRSGSMFTRPIRAIALAVLVLAPAPALRPFDALTVAPSVVAAQQGQGASAQVPSASDPPRYVLPPPHIVAAF